MANFPTCRNLLIYFHLASLWSVLKTQIIKNILPLCNKVAMIHYFLPSYFLTLQQSLDLQKISHRLIALKISALQRAKDLNSVIALHGPHPCHPSLPQQQCEYHIFQWTWKIILNIRLYAERISHIVWEKKGITENIESVRFVHKLSTPSFKVTKTLFFF